MASTVDIQLCDSCFVAGGNWLCKQSFQ